MVIKSKQNKLSDKKFKKIILSYEEDIKHVLDEMISSKINSAVILLSEGLLLKITIGEITKLTEILNQLSNENNIGIEQKFIEETISRLEKAREKNGIHGRMKTLTFIIQDPSKEEINILYEIKLYLNSDKIITGEEVINKLKLYFFTTR